MEICVPKFATMLHTSLNLSNTTDGLESLKIWLTDNLRYGLFHLDGNEVVDWDDIAGATMQGVQFALSKVCLTQC